MFWVVVGDDVYWLGRNVDVDGNELKVVAVDVDLRVHDV